jgi:hypothetical protein
MEAYDLLLPNILYFQDQYDIPKKKDQYMISHYLSQ